MIIYKKFISYAPKTNPFPEAGIIFLCDTQGNDWYESQKTFSADTLKIVFDDEGVIISAGGDVSALWPQDNSVAEIPLENVPEGFTARGEWVFDGSTIVAKTYTTEEYRTQAEAKRAVFYTTASAAMSPLQDAVDVDDATDEEIALLKIWKKYRVALNRLDLSTAPDIIWPGIPA